MNPWYIFSFLCGVLCTVFALAHTERRARAPSTVKPVLKSFRPFGERFAFMCIEFHANETRITGWVKAELYVEGWGRRWKEVHTSRVCTGETLELVHKTFLKCCEDAQIDPETGKALENANQ